MYMTSFRACLPVVALLAVHSAVGASDVAAGTYSVNQCDYERAITTSAFVWREAGVPAPIQHANSGCGEFGLAVRSSGVGTARTYADGAFGTWVASAPNGTVFTRFSGAFGTLVNCCITAMEPYAEVRGRDDDGDARVDLFRGPLQGSTWSAPSGSEGPVALEWTAPAGGLPAGEVAYGLRCGAVSGCPQTATGDVRVRGRTFEFTLDDLKTPEIANLGGDLLASGWIRGTRTLVVGGSDEGGGIAAVWASANGDVIASSPSACSKVGDRYVDLRPCPLVVNGSWQVDTSDLDDGATTLVVSVEDVGGSVAEETRIVRVDNTAPPAPTELSVDGGAGWSRSDEFTVRWLSPEQEFAPVHVVYAEVCSAASGQCGTQAYAGGGDGAVTVRVPGQGVFALRLWLEDAAGNVDASSRSTDVLLRFDDREPGRATIGGPGGWIGAAGAHSVPIEMGVEAEAELPISGIAGYSVTVDGTEPGGSVELSGATASRSLVGLPEGETLVQARAISGAGVPATLVGRTTIRVDRTAPDTAVVRGLDDRGWRRGAAGIDIMSSDQPNLSGVDAAPVDRPVAEGGYVTFTVNGSGSRVVRGNRATVTLQDDGIHALRYRAFDAAGNGSVEKEAVVRIDGTAPVGAFRAVRKEDPRALEVEVSDATSGVADGWIEYRRVGEAAFTPLTTAVRPGVLAARIDDAALPAGRYEVRAVVEDVAGNRAVVDRWADGSRVEVGMPLRAGAQVEAAGEVVVKRCPKAAKGRRKHGRRPARRPKCRRVTKAAKSLALRHGGRGVSRGRLTSQNAPIAHAPVTVEAQLRSGGGFTRIGTARTDQQGRFRFTIPAGASRTVRYRYEGTDTVLPAAASISTRVRAAARLKVDRRRLRNGQTVRFSGRLLGRPIPPAGKLVALQAKVGRGWRTFATPRANAKGAFKHRYRFTATTGLRRYAFRAVVAREEAYPYEKGVSKIVRVTVTGR